MPMPTRFWPRWAALTIASAFAFVLGYFMIYGGISGVFVGISLTLTRQLDRNGTSGERGSMATME